MKRCLTIQQQQRWSRLQKQNKRTIAIVPTMGALHAGHASLIRSARTMADVVVVTIFVNPLQFGPNEDFARYPRPLQDDLRMLRSLDVDCVFTPTAATMYGNSFQTQVTVDRLSRGLCGASRPNHFAGVATVVLKLLNAVLPDMALFGQKDYQQLQVIRQMVTDLNLPIRIIGIETVREPDGLAMSSRNRYLSPSERTRALTLPRALVDLSRIIKQFPHNPAKGVRHFQNQIKKSGLRLDYIAICDAQTLKSITHYQESNTLIAAAVFVGKTRLIDNIVI